MELYQGKHYRVVLKQKDKMSRAKGKKAKVIGKTDHVGIETSLKGPFNLKGDWVEISWWIPFTTSSEEKRIEMANKEAAELDAYQEHINTVEHRLEWPYDSKADKNRRREIDKLYNSLTKEQREMFNEYAQAKYDEGYEYGYDSARSYYSDEE
jgi:hypothetical protein